MGLSISGLGSGIDWRSLVSQLREVEESHIITPLTTQKAKQQERVSAWGSLLSKLSSLQTAAENLKDAEDFEVFSPILSSDNTTVSADSMLSVTTGTGAARGIYDLRIGSLAVAEKLQTADVITDQEAALGRIGTLTINGEELTLDGSESLQTLRNQINALDAGVTAGILLDQDGHYHLTMTSETEGAAGIALTEDYSAGTAIFSATPLQDGADAHFQVDGFSMTSSSNTVTDAIPGLTLELIKADNYATKITLEVDNDTSAVENQVQSFLDAYNNTMDFIDGHLSYNQDTNKTGGVLFGDGTLKSIKNTLQNMMVDAGLADLGISLGDDNRLSVDPDKLSSSLKTNFSSMVTSYNNLAQSLTDTLDGLTDSIDGTVTRQQQNAERLVDHLEEKISNAESRIDRKMELLTRQFINLDTALNMLQSQQEWLSSQLESLTTTA